MKRRIAYSYLCLGSSAKAKNKTFKRLLDSARRLCECHNVELRLDSFDDLSVPKANGENGLKTVLRGIEAGKISRRSVLLVEYLNDYREASPIMAYQALAAIIAQGVDVATLEDGKFHTKTSLADFSVLISSLAIMQRAADERSRRSAIARAAHAARAKETQRITESVTETRNQN